MKKAIVIGIVSLLVLGCFVGFASTAQQTTQRNNTSAQKPFAITTGAEIEWSEVANANPEIVNPSKQQYTPHVPIRLNSDADFNSQFPGRVISGYEINGAGIGSCIYIGNCSQSFTVRNCYLHDASGRMVPYFLNTGLGLFASSNGIVSNNTCAANTYVGIGLYDSYSNTLANNTCKANICLGIGLINSNSNTLVYNNCSVNSVGGLGLQSSNGNTVTNNDYYKNTVFGIGLNTSIIHNRIHHNNFIQNNGGGKQAVDNSTSGTNFWNTSSTPYGYGNYWSDWTTPDTNGDGIVDSPYILGGAGAKDYYPLVDPVPNAGSVNQLTVEAPNEVNESANFDVTVKLPSGSPANGATVTFEGSSKTADANGKVTFTAPQVSADKDCTIKASLSGYTDGTKTIKVKKSGGGDGNGGGNGGGAQPPRDNTILYAGIIAVVIIVVVLVALYLLMKKKKKASETGTQPQLPPSPPPEQPHGEQPPMPPQQ